MNSSIEKIVLSALAIFVVCFLLVTIKSCELETLKMRLDNGCSLDNQIWRCPGDHKK